MKRQRRAFLHDGAVLNISPVTQVAASLYVPLPSGWRYVLPDQFDPWVVYEQAGNVLTLRPMTQEEWVSFLRSRDDGSDDNDGNAAEPA